MIARIRHGRLSLTSPSLPQRGAIGSQGTLDLLIGMILADGVGSPYRRRYPPDQRNLQNEADNPRDRAIDREKSKPGQQKCDQQAHEADSGKDVTSLDVQIGYY